MKKFLRNGTIILGLIGTVTSISSCDLDLGVDFKFNQEMEQIVTILPNSTLRIDTTVIITSNLDSILLANNASKEDIESLVLAQIDVDLCDSNGVVYPSGVNFNEWDSVGVRVFVPNNPSVPNVLVAQTKVPRNLVGFGVGLTNSDFDMTPYSSNDEFALTLLNKLLTPVTTKKYVRVKVLVEVTAKI